MIEEFVEGAGGLKIFTRTWLPKSPARGMVVIVPGFKSHSGYYGWSAEQLNSRGFAVCALDLRGRGKSEGERFYVESFREYTSDVDIVVAHAQARVPTAPLFVLGHSAGGVVACEYALEHQASLAGLICESFAFQLPAPNLALALLKGVGHVAPHAPVLKLKAADFSRNPAVVGAMEADPLIMAEAERAQTIAELVRADERLEREFPSLTLPLLILHGTADEAANPAGSQLFYETAGAVDKTLKLYQGHVHDLLNDLGKELVMADISSWLEARVAST